MNNLPSCSYNSSILNIDAWGNYSTSIQYSLLPPGFIPKGTRYPLLMTKEVSSDQRFLQADPVNAAIVEDSSFFSNVSKVVCNLLGFPDSYLDEDEQECRCKTHQEPLFSEPDEEGECAPDEAREDALPTPQNDKDNPIKPARISTKSKLNILVGDDQQKPITVLCGIEKVSCFEDLTTIKESKARAHIHNHEITLISADETFRREFIQALPFTQTRIISAHGTLDRHDNDLVHHLDFLENKGSRSPSQRSVPTSEILPLFKNKQDCLFLFSCYGSAAHSSIKDDDLGDSILVSFSNPGAPLISDLAMEMESYIVECIKLDKQPLDIIINLVIRFPNFIAIKAPNKPTIFFNDRMFEDWKTNPEFKPTIIRLFEYLELKDPQLSSSEIKEHLKRRNELKLFDSFNPNQMMDKDTREAVLQKIKSADAACINKLKLQDGTSLLHHIILSISDLEEQISIPSNTRQFYKAIIDHYIKVGADLNVIDEYGHTPLHVAAPLKNAEWALKLISGGANLNIVGPNGTPLHLDLLLSQRPVLSSHLIRNGANVNLKNKEGITPLHIALKFHENSRIIDELLEAGADVNAVAHSGLTPMHLVVHQQVARVAQFIELGADLNVIRKSVGTPLDLAEDSEIIQLLRDAGALTAQELYQRGPETVKESKRAIKKKVLKKTKPLTD